MLIISERKPHRLLIFTLCALVLLTGMGAGLLTLVIDDGD